MAVRYLLLLKVSEAWENYNDELRPLTFLKKIFIRLAVRYLFLLKVKHMELCKDSRNR